MARELQNLDELGKAQLARIAKMPKDYRHALETIPVKRARRVAVQILSVGYCTTEWLQAEGYEHAPRAARDLRERGFQLETLYYRAANGRNMAVYVFGDFKRVQSGSKTRGRMAIDSSIKKALLEQYGNRYFIWLEEMPANQLQVDHRIPFEIAGESSNPLDPCGYMLLSASANRQKSWTCEHCKNWKIKDKNKCATCFWASPENYTHVACESGIVVPIRLSDKKAAKHYREAVSRYGSDAVRERIEYSVVKLLNTRDL